MSDDVLFHSISALGAAYRDRSLSPVEVTRRSLDRIERLDPALNAFITLLRAESLAQAEIAESELKAGRDRGPLHGVPVAVKDLIDMAGVPTTFASRACSPRLGTSDAAVVGNLKQAGAVILGKTNLLEYAYGAVHPDFGQTNNPWDIRRTSGGSSGGSVAAVAAGLCFAAIGTDTGGSIRIPAAYCGIAGLKPTFGRVSLQGVQELSRSLDHAGPVARSCADAAAMLAAMTGEAVHTAPAPLSGLRIGVLHHPGAERFLEPAIQTMFDDAIGALKTAGAKVQSLRLASLEFATGAIIKIIEPEASLVLRAVLQSEPMNLSAITRGQLEEGLSIAAVDYLAALQMRDRLRAEFKHAFESVDALISPSVPWVAPAEDPPVGGESGAGEMLYSGPCNLAGLPALSVPCGLSPDGLPGGLQITTSWGRDELALSIGAAFEALRPIPRCPFGS